MIRALTIAVAVVAALPTIVTAQGGRQFKDAWFWGVKAGGFSFADSGGGYHTAPEAGIEWLITRSRGGLYISGSQAFFTSKILTLHDPSAPVDSGPRVINLKNERKLEVALMGFPGDHIRFHPYAGLGFVLGEIADAVPVGPFGNQDQLTFANQVIQNQKVQFSPVLILGAQYRLKWASVFGQGTFSPAQREFLLYNGRPLNFSFDIGLRYNIGTSIDRQ